jgi:hypothetical protein
MEMVRGCEGATAPGPVAVFVHVIQGPRRLLTSVHIGSELLFTHIDLSHPLSCGTVSDGVHSPIRIRICDATSTKPRVVVCPPACDTYTNSNGHRLWHGLESHHSSNCYACDTGQTYRGSKGFAQTSPGCPQVSRQPQGMMPVHSLTMTSSYQGFVQVAVGKEQHLQVFDVHEYLITARSPFFRKVMSGNWQEAKDRLVKLPEDDPAIFQLYVHLLYTNMLAVIPNPGLAKDDSMEEVSRLAKLYVLAEKLQDIETKDLVVEAMLLGSREIRKDGQCYAPGPEAVGAIYAGTMPGSPMRRLYVDIYTYRANSIWLSKNSGDWPSEFVHELALELLDKRKTSADPTKTADLSSYKELRSAAAP